MKSAILFLGLSILLISCNVKEENEEPIDNNTKVISSTILDFANNYNAIVSWDTTKIFATVQLEDLILNKNRPILIDNKLILFGDIYRTNESYHFRFSFYSRLAKYYFDLECNDLQKVELLDKIETGFFIDIVAIAEIQNVKKISHVIESELTEINSESIDLNLGFSNDFFINGKLIDLLNVTDE